MADVKANVSEAAPRRPAYNRATTSSVPLTLMRRASAPVSPGLAEQDSYFPDLPSPIATKEPRRPSYVAEFFSAARRTSISRALNNQFNPPEEELVEPFSFVSVKTSWWPTINMAIGLLGQAGYMMGSACIEHVAVDIPPPPGVNPGVGSSADRDMNGTPEWFSPSLGPSITIFSLGIIFGITSSLLFLRDGLRIAGNKNKAYTYVTAHLTGIVLISLSRTITDYRKNLTPHQHLVALTLPASLGRGMHWVTIPRSFSNSEVTRGDFAKLSFEQRLMLSEGLRVVASIFFGLWAGSWAIADYNPLQREFWAIMGSLTLNVSAALPNTNLRRADIFRRSQQSLASPHMQSFRLQATPRASDTTGPSRSPPVQPEATTLRMEMPQ